MEINFIINQIIKFLKKGNPLLKGKKKIPTNISLLQAGYLDLFGFLELVSFIEKKFKITIKDDEITPEKFGSLNKMSALIKIKKELTN